MVGVKVYASDENLEREVELARISAEEWAREHRGTGEVILLPARPEYR